MRIVVSLILTLYCWHSAIKLQEQGVQDRPEIITAPAPTLSSLPLLARASGKVTYDVEINDEGKVDALSFVEGHALLKQLTQEALQLWKFKAERHLRASRRVRITLIYPPISYYENATIQVLPYNINLVADAPINKALENQIPETWQPGKDKCPVHRSVLKEDRVSIIYGLMGFREGYWKARERFFPNANLAVLGGCLVMTDKKTGRPSPEFSDVLFCEQCRIAEKKWGYKNRYKKIL